MAATQYMVLYRAVNPNTNLPITNDPNNEYKPVLEFYNAHHKMYAGNAAQQDEAIEEQQEIVTAASDSNNPKFDMFFAYDGTKKVKHWGISKSDQHTEAPYAIMDTYKRIPLSPWFMNCITASLDAALEKAKKLVGMIGMENVKVIKVVAFDQFLKMK